MMDYIKVSDSLINKVLIPNAGADFRVGDGQKNALSGEEILNGSRLLSVYTTSIDFTGRQTGPVQAKPQIFLDFFVSASSTVDLSVVDDPNSTPAQRATAIAAAQQADALVNRSMDEFWSIVYQIVMNATYNQLALDYEVGAFPVDNVRISDRKLTRLDKDQPSDFGEFVTLTARGTLEYRLTEQVSGIIGTPSTEGVVDGIKFADIETGTVDEETKTGIQTIIPT